MLRTSAKLPLAAAAIIASSFGPTVDLLAGTSQEERITETSHLPFRVGLGISIACGCFGSAFTLIGSKLDDNLDPRALKGCYKRRARFSPPPLPPLAEPVPEGSSWLETSRLYYSDDLGAYSKWCHLLTRLKSRNAAVLVPQ